MEKTAAVASLGHRRLMLPAWVRAALSANDRLKVYLTVLQAASLHASQPKHELPDLAAEMTAANLSAAWLREFAEGATRIDKSTSSHDWSTICSMCLVSRRGASILKWKSSSLIN
jgi:hypothetical protein